MLDHSLVMIYSLNAYLWDPIHGLNWIIFNMTYVEEQFFSVFHLSKLGEKKKKKRSV